MQASGSNSFFTSLLSFVAARARASQPDIIKELQKTGVMDILKINFLKNLFICTWKFPVYISMMSEP